MRTRSGNLRLPAGALIAALGGILLALAVAGEWGATGAYESFPPRPWERFDPGLANRTQDLESLYREAEARAGLPFRKLPPAAVMRTLYESVSDRFTHGDRSRYTPESNWILWAMGSLAPKFSMIQDPDALLKYGHSALCSEVSHVLVRLAGKAGIPSRHVNFNGHVAVEAWYDDGGHFYDPDLEVTVPGRNGKVLSADDLARDRDRVLRAYAGRGNDAYVRRIADIIGSREDNRFLPVAPDLRPPPLSPRLAIVERAAGIGKFAVPALLVLLGLRLLHLPPRKRRQDQEGIDRQRESRIPPQ